MAIQRVRLLKPDNTGLVLEPFDYNESGGFLFNEVIGWYGSGQSDGQFDPIPGRNGTYAPLRTTIPGATPTIQGTFIGDTSAQADDIRNYALPSLRNGGEQITMEVTDETMTTTRQVFIRRIDPQYNRFADFTFAIDMYADDPLRYGDKIERSTALPTSSGGIAFPIVFPIDFGIPGNPGQVTLRNPSTEEVGVYLTITGGLSQGFTIQVSETGEYFVFNRVIPVDSFVTLDPRLGLALLGVDENDVSGSIGPGSSWIRIPAGKTRTLQFNQPGAASGTPTLTASIRPAYL